jgi:hypothetical protein
MARLECALMFFYSITFIFKPRIVGVSKCLYRDSSCAQILSSKYVG